MPQITEKHFYQYIKCPLWLYFDVHSDEQKLVDPLVERLQQDGLIPEKEREVLGEREYAEVGVEDLEEAYAKTLELMKEGVQTIYHGILMNGRWVGRPDLLERVEGRSKFGEHYYVACDIKQGRKVRAEYMFQGAFYAELLRLIQGVKPVQGYVINPDGHTMSYLLEDFQAQLNLSIDEIERIMAGQRPAHFAKSGCKQSPWFEECKMEAEACNDPSLINRIRESEVLALKKAGLKTISALAKCSHDELEKINGIDLERLLELREQATALTKDEIVVKQEIEFPEAKTELYFDIESDPLRDLHYLFGVLEVKGKRSKYHSFVAEKPADEQKNWEAFLSYLSKHKDTPIYHWGTYEVDVLRQLAFNYGLGEPEVDQITKRMIDLLPIVREAVIFPLYYYSLKDVAKHLGYEWSEEGVTGVDSVLWYEEYLANRRKKTKLKAIIKYNEDDVRATWLVKKWAAEQTVK